MQDTDLTKRDLFADKVNVDLNVLRPPVLHWIGGHVYSADVVAVHHGGRNSGNMKLLKKMPQPTALSNGMSNGMVLGLCTRAGHRCLAFGGPRHQVVTEINAVAGRRAPRVRTAGPVGVGVGGERCHR